MPGRRLRRAGLRVCPGREAVACGAALPCGRGALVAADGLSPLRVATVRPGARRGSARALHPSALCEETA
jgi:hypothetical protein